MSEIRTHSGRTLSVEDPDPDAILIEDIAHALSFLCRGAGQTNFFFPVARHCVLCAGEAEARGMSRDIVLACLLHDASEAYMVDIPRPIKDTLIPAYRICENRLLDCIYRKFLGRPLTESELATVSEIDDALLSYDLRFLLNMDVPLAPLHIPVDYVFEPMEQTRQAYLDTFYALTASQTEKP